MARHSDQMITRYMEEMEEKRQLVDGLVEKAQTEKRDLDEKEMELVTRSRDRIKEIDGQLDPLVEARRIHVESEERIATLAEFVGEREGPPRRSNTARPARTFSTTGRPGSGARTPVSGSSCTTAPPRTRPPATTRGCCRPR